MKYLFFFCRLSEQVLFAWKDTAFWEQHAVCLIYVKIPLVLPNFIFSEKNSFVLSLNRRFAPLGLEMEKKLLFGDYPHYVRYVSIAFKVSSVKFLCDFVKCLFHSFRFCCLKK